MRINNLCKHLVQVLGHNKYSVTIIIILFSYAQCFTLLFIQHCHCLHFKNHRTLSACTYLDKASIAFTNRTADLWQLWGFILLILLSFHPSFSPPLHSLSKSLPFTYFWEDLRRSHVRTVTAKSLKERSEQRHVKEVNGNIFKHMNETRLNT